MDSLSSDEDDFCEENGEAVLDEYYVIDKILATISIGNDEFFYIKWLGWPYSQCTWEPLKNILFGGQPMADFLEKEKLLSVLRENVIQRLEDNHLYQLRNLDRWERRINNACLVLDNKLFVCNDVDDACKPKLFQYVCRNIYKGFGKASKNSIKKRCHCPEKYFCDGTPIFALNGRYHKLAILRTKERGWGIFALENIPEGQLVFEFVGEVLTAKGANKRDNFDYQFNLNCDGGTKFIIDAKYMGNESAFVNHSCQASLKAFIIYVDDAAPAFHRMALFSKIDLIPGAELTLDYYPQVPKTTQEFQVHGSEKDNLTMCRCNKKPCITYFPPINPTREFM